MSYSGEVGRHMDSSTGAWSDISVLSDSLGIQERINPSVSIELKLICSVILCHEQTCYLLPQLFFSVICWILILNL